MTWCGVGLLSRPTPTGAVDPGQTQDLDRPRDLESGADSMFGYIVRRLIAAFLVVVLTSMITFAVFFLGPSNPRGPHLSTRTVAAPPRSSSGSSTSSASTRASSRSTATFVKGIFVDREIEAGATYHCDAPCLGISYSTKLEVRKEMTKRYPVTSVARHRRRRSSSSASASRMGVLAARWRGTVTDRVPGDRQPVRQRGPVLRGLPDGVDLPGQRVGHLLGRQRLCRR